MVELGGVGPRQIRDAIENPLAFAGLHFGPWAFLKRLARRHHRSIDVAGAGGGKARHRLMRRGMDMSPYFVALGLNPAPVQIEIRAILYPKLITMR
jgi:hypothetical protein